MIMMGIIRRMSIYYIWFKFDYNRGDDYAKLKAGKQYKVKGYGFRVGFLDSYQKIYEVEAI